MIYRFFADFILVAHLAFVVFVLMGGLLALRWPRLVWVHLPCVIWGVLIELVGFVCPLTPLEITLRKLSGAAGYQGGFIEHYITTTLYPLGLTREVQIALGVVVLILNTLVYGYVLTKRSR